MKLKLDENIGGRGARLLRLAGHDVLTVPEQNLCSASDRRLIAVCREERRCIVTLDLDYANPLVFNPLDFFGIVVLRPAPRSVPESFDQVVKTLIGGLARASVVNKLWIVQPGRIRQYETD